MNDRIRWCKQAAIACLAAAWLGGALAAEPMTTTDDLLKNPKFKSAYVAALGPKAKEKWLATMTNSALVRDETIAGERWQVATPCKPHDCGDNNLLLLYSASRGAVVGHLYENGKVTTLGSPSAAMSAQLQRLWNKEFRQR
jgi:hypothetical protein